MAVSSNKKNNDLLEQFLGEFQELASQVTQRAVEVTDDKDEKLVIQAFAPSLINQVSELGTFIREGVQKSSAQQIGEVQQVLKVSSGVSLTKNAKGILPSLGSIIGKLGISKIVKEIKKIIRAILEALGIKLPKWIDIILNIIDEIFDAIFSAGSPKLATTLSIQEQNYLAELTQLAKLQQANQFKFQEEDEDDN